MKAIQQLIILVFLTSLFTVELFGQSQQFVSLKGNQFKLNGEDFYPVVMNYGVSVYRDNSTGDFFIGPHKNYEDIIPTDATDGYNMLVEDFNTIENTMNFNCVRIVGLTFGKINFTDTDIYSDWPAFAFDYPVTPNSIQRIESPYSLYFDLIRKVLEAAEEAQLKVIFVAGGKKLDTPGVKDEFEGVNGYLENLVNEFTDNNSLFAYDFWNEPMYNDDTEYSKNVICGMVGMWNDIVHQQSSYHLTTIGLGFSSGIFEWDHGVMKLDFVSFHFYPESIRGINDRHPTSDELALAYDMVKSELYWYGNNSPLPWIVGETGFSANIDDNFMFDFGSVDDQGDYAGLTLNQCRDCYGSGYSWWWYQDVNYGGETAYYGLIDRLENTKDPAINAFNSFDPQALGSCDKPNNYYNYYNYELAWVTGTVIDQEGLPIEDAIVSLRAADWTGKIYKTYTDSEGLFKVYTDIIHDEKKTMLIKVSAVGASVYGYENVYLGSDIGDVCLHQFQPNETDELNNITVDFGEKYFSEVTDMITTKNFIIEGNGTTGGECILKAGNRIILSSDFIAKKGSKFHAKNAPVYMPCGYLPEKCKETELPEVSKNNLLIGKENEMFSEDHILLYPNPTTGIININLPVSPSNTSIKLMDIHGKVVFEKDYQKERYLITINASNYRKGIYFLTIMNEEFTLIKKVILQ